MIELLLGYEHGWLNFTFDNFELTSPPWVQATIQSKRWGFFGNGRDLTILAEVNHGIAEHFSSDIVTGGVLFSVDGRTVLARGTSFADNRVVGNQFGSHGRL